MPEVNVRGYSDDLISVTGAIDAEYEASYNEPDYLAFSDGTVLRVEFGSVWRITFVARSATSNLVIDKALEDDEDNYTDRAKLTGDVAWVVLGREITHARKDHAA